MVMMWADDCAHESLIASPLFWPVLCGSAWGLCPFSQNRQHKKRCPIPTDTSMVRLRLQETTRNFMHRSSQDVQPSA